MWFSWGVAGEWSTWGGCCTTCPAGKAYNKAMRAHKLTLQAMWQILLPVFLVFVKESDKDCYDNNASLTAIDDLENIPLLISSLSGFKSFWRILLRESPLMWTLYSGGVIWTWCQYYCSSFVLNGMVSGTFISTRSVKCYLTSRGTTTWIMPDGVQCIKRRCINFQKLCEQSSKGATLLSNVQLWNSAPT